MKNIFNFRTDKNEVTFCPVCGEKLTNDFCNVCNRYISPEKANERLKEKYPHVKKCEKCKSKKIVFTVEEELTPVPKSFIDKIVITILQKHDEKYPQEIPAYREVAKCNKCGHKWYVDGYRDVNKTLLLLKKYSIIAIVVLALMLMIAIGSLFENEDSYDATISENTTTQIAQADVSETEDSYQNTTEIPRTEDITTTVDTTIAEEKTESTTISTTTATTDNETTTTKKGRTVYITPYGEKYHFSAGCAGKNAMGRDYNDVKDVYDPCSKCAY